MATGREVKAGRLAKAMRREQQHNLSGMARILLNGDFTFCLTRDFNELDVAKKSTQQLLRDQLHDEPWMIARSFESLGMPRRNCFDLLVNTIVARACDRIPY
jgi:hypothetical protein